MVGEEKLTTVFQSEDQPDLSQSVESPGELDQDGVSLLIFSKELGKWISIEKVELNEIKDITI